MDRLAPVLPAIFDTQTRHWRHGFCSVCGPVGFQLERRLALLAPFPGARAGFFRLSCSPPIIFLLHLMDFSVEVFCLLHRALAGLGLSLWISPPLLKVFASWPFPGFRRFPGITRLSGRAFIQPTACCFSRLFDTGPVPGSVFGGGVCSREAGPPTYCLSMPACLMPTVIKPQPCSSAFSAVASGLAVQSPVWPGNVHARWWSVVQCKPSAGHAGCVTHHGVLCAPPFGPAPHTVALSPRVVTICVIGF